MSDQGLGFFNTPAGGDTPDSIKRRLAYAQALQEQGAANPGNTPYAGLANLGKSLAGALIGRQADNAQKSNYATLLGNTLGSKGLNDNPVQVTPEQVAAAPPGSPQPITMTPSAPDTKPIESYQGPLAQALGDRKSALLGSLLQGVGPEQGTQMLQSAAMQAVDNEDKRMTLMTPAEVKAAGYRDGAVVYKDAMGGAHVSQESDLKSPGAVQQQIDIAGKTPITPYQQAEIDLSKSQHAEAVRHDKAEEYNAMHPFGMGASGSTATGGDFLKSLSPGMAGQIKAIGDYRQAPPANRASKEGIALMSMVNQYNPSYDATQFGSKTKARNDFATGKNGNTVRSLNVAVQHLDQLGQLSGALGNGNVQAFNQLGQAYAQQTGSPAPTNFEAAKQLVSDEIVKAIVGSGGGVADRENAAATISKASSPQQLAGVIQTYQGLMSGQLSGLKQQYEKSTGLTDFEDYLAPETKAKLQSHSANAAQPGGQSSPRKVVKFGDLP